MPIVKLWQSFLNLQNSFWQPSDRSKFVAARRWRPMLKLQRASDSLLKSEASPRGNPPACTFCSSGGISFAQTAVGSAMDRNIFQRQLGYRFLA